MLATVLEPQLVPEQKESRLLPGGFLKKLSIWPFTSWNLAVPLVSWSARRYSLLEAIPLSPLVNRFSVGLFVS